jgi:hypothetical protein
MRSTTGSLLLLVSLLAVSPAVGAEIKEVAPVKAGEEQIQKITLTGRIEAGDADKLENLISENDYTIVSLNGDGGDYQEALAVAKVFSDSIAMTIVEDGASCLSACAIAFLGGSGDTDDSGDYAAARSIAPTARLGFNAPTLDVSDTTLTKQTVESAYAHVLKFISDFVLASNNLHVAPEVIAEIISPRGSETYFVKDAHDLAHLGIEIQKVAPPSALTPSMARNLCQMGWSATRGKAETRTDEAMANLNWKPADTTFVAKSDYFGGGLPVRRTVIPFEFMTDDPQDGYTFCLVDQTREAGVLEVACRGFIYGNDLATAMERARHFDGQPDQGESGDADIDCDITPLIEPLTPLPSSVENRWALVPGNTPLGKIAETLAGYVAKEPAL